MRNTVTALKASTRRLDRVVLHDNTLKCSAPFYCNILQNVKTRTFYPNIEVCCTHWKKHKGGDKRYAFNRLSIFSPWRCVYTVQMSCTMWNGWFFQKTICSRCLSDALQYIDKCVVILSLHYTKDTIRDSRIFDVWTILGQICNHLRVCNASVNSMHRVYVS